MRVHCLFARFSQGVNKSRNGKMAQGLTQIVFQAACILRNHCSLRRHSKASSTGPPLLSRALLSSAHAAGVPFLKTNKGPTQAWEDGKPNSRLV